MILYLGMVWVWFGYFGIMQKRKPLLRKGFRSGRNRTRREKRNVSYDQRELNT